jgi:hypothetical protein
MQILINVTSCGTLIGQALSKTAFAVTLLKLTKGWPRWILWFCIASMNAYTITKLFFQWAKICDKPSYDVWYRLDFCLTWKFRENFKEGGNGMQSPTILIHTVTDIAISLQHHHGFRYGHFSMVHHLEPRHAQSRKNRSLLDHELGNDRRHHRCHPDWLERWWQRKGRMVLLAKRTFKRLVLFRNRRHYHCPMYSRVATASPRHPHILDVKKAGITRWGHQCSPQQNTNWIHEQQSQRKSVLRREGNYGQR